MMSAQRIIWAPPALPDGLQDMSPEQVVELCRMTKTPIDILLDEISKTH
jgi:hypothetical protein